MHFYIVELRKEYRFPNSTGVAMSSFDNAIKLIIFLHILLLSICTKKFDKSTVVKKPRQDNVSYKTSYIRIFIMNL